MNIRNLGFSAPLLIAFNLFCNHERVVINIYCKMYALANNSVYAVYMLYFEQYCFLLLLHNVPIWDRGKCVSLAHFTSPVPVIHTWQCLCTKRVFFLFHCRTLSWPIVYCNISLRPISFLHCEPVIQRSWEICIYCRQLPHLAYRPVSIIFFSFFFSKLPIVI